MARHFQPSTIYRRNVTPPNTVMQVFKMTSFDTILSIVDTSEAALEGIN